MHDQYLSRYKDVLEAITAIFTENNENSKLSKSDFEI